MTYPAPIIELRRLHRFFGATKAVEDVSFEVHRGEVFGYIGPNGAGKTTSMRILATLDVPTYGDALIDGFSVVNDPDKVRSRLGFMPDAFGTYRDVNCLEYLDFYARAYGLKGRERHQAMRRTMSFTQLDGLAEKSTRSLSKGMKQRLCLARAMIHNPAVLILDEPAAGLDPRARIELRQLIGQLAADGKTVLISSHILTELAEMCDRVAIIEHGRLLAKGSVEEIISGDAGDIEAALATIRITLVGPGAPLADWLSRHEGVAEARAAGDMVVLSGSASREWQADLLRDVLAAGFRVCRYEAREATLEDAFLKITRGKVQ